MGHQILAVGEVLWDLLPSGKQLGGAPPISRINAVRSVPTRGWSRGSAMIPWAMRSWSDSGSWASRPRPFRSTRVVPTGTVDVALAPDGQPRFTIREHVAWDRIEADEASLARAARADAVCFGSLAQRDEPSRAAIRTLVAAAAPGPCACST